MCLPVCGQAHVWMQVGTLKVQDRVFDPLEMQLWAAVSLLMQVLRTKLWSSVWAVHVLLLSHLHRPPPPLPQTLSYTRNPYGSIHRQVRHYQNGILSVTHKQCVCTCTCMGASLVSNTKIFRGPERGQQLRARSPAPYGSSQPPVTLVPGDLTLSADLCRHQAHKCRQNTHT